MPKSEEEKYIKEAYQALIYMEKLQKGEADIDDEPSVRHCWSGIMAVPKEDPLHFLCESIEGFRECADYIENNVATPEKMKDFVIFGNWMGAGALCFDLKVNEDDVNTDNSDTWQICWFDHEEFDWEDIDYVDSEGNITGDKIFPSFKAFIDIYFYGVFDKIYEKQLKEDNEELPDKSSTKEGGKI